MTFFALGLEKATIYSRREIFSPAEVRFHSFVADQRLSLPGAEDIQMARTADQRRNVVRSLVPDVLQKWETVKIEEIPNRHTFQFGDTGRILYSSNEIPMMIDWIMLVIEDDSDIRDLGAELNEFFNDHRLDAAATSILSLIGTAMTPQIAAGIVLGKMLVRGITSVLKDNEDDQLGVIEQSFIRPLHYPHGTRHGIGVGDLSGNMWYDYFIYGTDDI